MFKTIYLFYLICFLVLLQTNYVATTDCDSEPSSIEGKLLKKLLCSDNYDKTERPVRNHNTTVNVTMLMYIKEYYVLEREPSVIVSVWLSISWTDEFLAWDRADYGLEMVNIDSNELWRPTIETLESKPAGIIDKSCRDHQCEVKHNGNVSCISPCSFNVHCFSTNVDWPFDVLECSLYMSSWMEYSAELNITRASNVSQQYLKEQSNWHLLSTNVLSSIDTTDVDYSWIIYKFVLERRMGVYSTVITPGFMVVVISLAVLWLNSASSERLYVLSVTCLGHYIYLEYIYWHLTYNTKDVPKLSQTKDSMLAMYKYCSVIFVVLLCLRHGATINCDGTGDAPNKEAKLIRNLFCFNYDKSERPVKDHNTAINVTASMHVQNYDVSEEKSTLFLYVWMSFSWKDEFLNWDRAEYGIDKLIVDSSELWRPTFVAFHNLKSGNGDNACASHPCEVKQTGVVLCVPPCQYEALCSSNTANWPFDSLKCTMFLGAWLENFNQINISRMSNLSTRDIEVTHAEWKIQSAILLHIYLPDNTSYPSLEYVFTLERHIAIYGAILTPGFLMIIINLAVLWMNSGSTERLYILCATCMGHFSYMEYLYWRVPYHGEAVPKMLLFFRDSLMINVLMLAFTIILRHTAPKADGTERLVDKLATRVASTNLGRMFLQTGDQAGSEVTDTTEAESGDRDNSIRSQPDHVDGDTVNLVSDASDNDAPTKRIASAEHQRPNVVNVFLDRIMFICFLLSYVLMIFSLLPKENLN
ncbi:neuronal acetylcholine receptor subunit beta-3-like [Anopheles maculipalpis]|uniref:neuronal acetylcholine receptor subunit beta-3-like n=1 Tax=Anopheles maculipalpis TaxID=1496333 RepID=UPI002159B334|nr:neuronal acetylcholine receptor subunit beta-3-like [Anopheles maculipalpis]